MNFLPPWFRQELPGESALNMAHLLSGYGLSTVCQEAQCPNLNFCFKNSRCTFLILGDTCTRNCLFCAVRKTENPDNLRLDEDEPSRIAGAVARLNLNYVVITSVTRDDLEDGGARIFSETIRLIRRLNRQTRIEVLLPDFRGSITSLQCVVGSRPDIVAHNIETVERLYPALRPKASYQLSLGVLEKIKELKAELMTKSSLILGLGETRGEVMETMQDLRSADVEMLTLGQYLSPSPKHYPVREFIFPEAFRAYRDIALDLGFKAVSSGPLVRSSYPREEEYKEIAYA